MYLLRFPSPIQTILSVPESHRLSRTCLVQASYGSRTCALKRAITVGGESHPAPKDYKYFVSCFRGNVTIPIQKMQEALDNLACLRRCLTGNNIHFVSTHPCRMRRWRTPNDSPRFCDFNPRIPRRMRPRPRRNQQPTANFNPRIRVGCDN